MRLIAAVALAVAGCAGGPHVVKQQSVAAIAPAEREAVFSRALTALQRRGWIIAVADRAAGFLTTQPMSTGFQSCGSITCSSRSTLQVTLADTGKIAVDLHREFLVPPPGAGWFAPTLERDVRPIEQEQNEIFAEILGSRPAASVKR